ncbi:TraR/DksA family transcriptional regulator [Pseudomonas gingeri]|uniref:TraR/DksA family transcriptional regulator n=1 Tax=Pseudomonas gingeri TaxID=117681 RepID=A0A7Y7XGF8_9PSED|nr:TraR/DksA family transcriptional regulator [Pseudomonas gingeri]NWB99081.1 TraR/DksA family transcriptional regulator [Pseudomonas gingeri]
MVDWFDRAQAQELRERELAIAAQLARVRPSGPSRSHCQDCGNKIPTQRQALPGITRCVPCQTTFEKGSRR